MVEIVLQEAVRRRQRVLVCAASNVAVDNLVERIQRKAEEIPSLKGNKFRLVRVGHPARLLPQVLDSCLDSLVLRSDSSQLADDCVKEIKEINRKLMRLKRHERETRRKLRGSCLNRVRTRHQKAISEVLGRPRSWPARLHDEADRRDDFDLVVVDEAAQASECATWSALLKEEGGAVWRPPAASPDDQRGGGEEGLKGDPLRAAAEVWGRSSQDAHRAVQNEAI